MDIEFEPDQSGYVAARDQQRAGFHTLADSLSDLFTALTDVGFERMEALELTRDWLCMTIEAGEPQEEDE